MTRKLVFRPEALADLNEVEANTRRTWGNEQARQYAAALVTNIKALRLSALRHPLFDHIHPGLRRKRSGMHHIYYVATDDSVEVLMVIHAQRDPALHLRMETWGEKE